MLMMILRREGSCLLAHNLATAAFAAINSRMIWCGGGAVLFIESVVIAGTDVRGTFVQGHSYFSNQCKMKPFLQQIWTSRRLFCCRPMVNDFWFRGKLVDLSGRNFVSEWNQRQLSGDKNWIFGGENEVSTAFPVQPANGCFRDPRISAVWPGWADSGCRVI